MNANNTKDTVLSFLAYAILLAAAVCGVKFNIIDSNAANLIIGGVLVHFGIYAPPGTTIVRSEAIALPQEEKKP